MIGEKRRREGWKVRGRLFREGKEKNGKKKSGCASKNSWSQLDGG